MPVVHIHLIEGRTIDQKRALVDKVTKAVCESVNVTPQDVEIILQDMAKHDYAVAGVLRMDQQK